MDAPTVTPDGAPGSAGATEHPDLAAPDPDDDTPIGWTLPRALGVAVAVALLGFWVWAFSPWAPNDKADGVRDATFLTTARTSCKTMQDGLAALPPARDAKTAAERADVVAATGPVIASMITELRAASSTLDARDRELVDRWLTDWEAYNADRQTYAANLRTDERSEFFVTRRGTGQITVTMDNFSRVNDLGACLVPMDV